MRDFILKHTGLFALGYLGSVVAGTGLGALAISFGTPVMVVVYTQLVLQVILALAVAVGVPERVGGLVAVALTTVVPLGGFVAWSEVALSKTTNSAGLVAALGAVIMCLAGWRSLTSQRLPERIEVPA